MIKEFTLSNKGAIKVNLVDSRFGEIRVVIQNKELYFCAKDVCFAFGMRDYKRYVSQYCKHIHHFYHDTNGGVQILNFIDYQDVLHIFEHSKLEDATDLLYNITSFIIIMENVLNCTDDDDDDDDDDYDYCSDCEYRAVCDCDGDCDNCDDCEGESCDDCSDYVDDRTENHDCDDNCDNSDDEFECDGDCENCDEYYDCEVPVNERNQSTEKAAAKIIKGVSMILESVEELLQNSSESEESEIA